MGAAQAVAIVRRRLQLVVGDEIGVTAYEVSSGGNRTRLAAADLPIVAQVLTDEGVEPGDFDALVVLSNDGETTVVSADMHDEVTVEILGAPDGPLTVLRTLDPSMYAAILAEAAASAWRQRLSDAADAGAQLTTSDAEVIGPIAIPGAPLLTELRVERRRPPAKEASGGAPTAADTQVSEVLDEMIADLRASVRFGAAGLVETPEDQLAKGLASAVADGSWVQRLRLLMAAQEIAAIELVKASHDDRAGVDSERSSAAERILDRLDTEWTATEDLAAILSDLRDVLPVEPTGHAQRLLRRRLLEDTRSVRRAIDVYISVTQSPVPTADESVSWDDALDALGQLDDASAHGPAIALPAVGTSGQTKNDTQVVPNIDDIARWLGEIFARQLPESRKQMDELARRHPGENVDALVARVKRQAIADFGTAGTEDGSRPVLETVAALAMSVALLRGTEPHSEAEFAELGRRILDRTQGIADMRDRAGHAIPLAVEGFERIAHLLQPVVVEALFRAMAMAAPSQAGAARDFYKNARSVVWRARHKRGFAAAAAMGAGRALQQALGSGAARLLVREVDRALAAPKSR
ncbi:hypothetical protein [Rhodococcus sp. NCIMB 12038]|uniref:hypothetical protein n=1 Tax=Rhodococcus sp. NCIMB 12038 TaxID=933800 RepID=UPI000B3CB1E4|nr:hypothetical protein [Rhodococcus sp. NCIMB 12038]OUS97248.1 hypothetical protein CA951_02565 [Rhodococcus sp. NCIMB 12038]